MVPLKFLFFAVGMLVSYRLAAEDEAWLPVSLAAWWLLGNFSFTAVGEERLVSLFPLGLFFGAALLAVLYARGTVLNFTSRATAFLFGVAAMTIDYVLRTLR